MLVRALVPYLRKRPLLSAFGPGSCMLLSKMGGRRPPRKGNKYLLAFLRLKESNLWVNLFTTITAMMVTSPLNRPPGSRGRVTLLAPTHCYIRSPQPPMCKWWGLIADYSLVATSKRCFWAVTAIHLRAPPIFKKTACTRVKISNLFVPLL